jgi:hypothetical protein
MKSQDRTDMMKDHIIIMKTYDNDDKEDDYTMFMTTTKTMT